MCDDDGRQTPVRASQKHTAWRHHQSGRQGSWAKNPQHHQARTVPTTPHRDRLGQSQNSRDRYRQKVQLRHASRLDFLHLPGRNSGPGNWCHLLRRSGRDRRQPRTSRDGAIQKANSTDKTCDNIVATGKTICGPAAAQTDNQMSGEGPSNTASNSGNQINQSETPERVHIEKSVHAL